MLRDGETAGVEGTVWKEGPGTQEACPMGPRGEAPGMTGGQRQEEENTGAFTVVSTARNGQGRVERLRSG